MLMAAKSEIADLQEEHQRESEALLESVRNATKEDKYLQLTIDNYIPRDFQVSFYLLRNISAGLV